MRAHLVAPFSSSSSSPSLLLISLPPSSSPQESSPSVLSPPFTSQARDDLQAALAAQAAEAGQDGAALKSLHCGKW